MATNIGFKWLKPAKNKLTWSDFTTFSCNFLYIQIASVCGHSEHFIFKTCQIVAGTSLTRQFHEIFNLISGGFLTFSTTVRHCCHHLLLIYASKDQLVMWYLCRIKIASSTGDILNNKPEVDWGEIISEYALLHTLFCWLLNSEQPTWQHYMIFII